MCSRPTRAMRGFVDELVEVVAALAVTGDHLGTYSGSGPVVVAVVHRAQPVQVDRRPLTPIHACRNRPGPWLSKRTSALANSSTGRTARSPVKARTISIVDDDLVAFPRRDEPPRGHAVIPHPRRQYADSGQVPYSFVTDDERVFLARTRGSARGASIAMDPVRHQAPQLPVLLNDDRATLPTSSEDGPGG